MHEICAEAPPSEFLADPALATAIERLNRIAGFVTTITTPDDPRASVFNRYHHVQRVSWVARELCKVDENALDDTMRLVWLHDINRWPFAHNSEKGSYSQAENSAKYLARFQQVNPREAASMRAFHERDLASLERAGRFALLADMIAGVLEDPLMLTAGLNTHPKIVPLSVSEEVGVRYTDTTTVSEIKNCAESLHLRRSTVEFQEAFATLFAQSYERFMQARPSVKDESGIEDLLLESFVIAKHIKKTFLRPVVFPINNESVCHGHEVRSRIVEPLLREWGIESATSTLLEVDELSLFLLIEADKEVPTLRRSDFAPDLDFVIRSTPDRALVRT